MGRKLKIYLDTSVPNAYVDDKNSVRQEATKDFWTKIEQYKVYVSDVVEEVEAIGEDERGQEKMKGVKEDERGQRR